ncbi:MAG: fatty acid desaturase family protein [Pseudomonadota bacterium]
METTPGKSDFLELREELNRLGYNRRTPYAIVAEWSFFVLLAAAGVATIILGDAWWMKAVGMTMLTFGSMGIATNAHTASHHAISRRKWLNDFFLYFGYPFFHQVSANFWRHKHLVVHHPHPNVVGVDADADLAPYFTLDQAEYERATGFHRWWYRNQMYFLPVVLIGNFFSVAWSAWAFLFRRLADPRHRDASHWLDLFSLAMHWAVWVVLPLMFFDPVDVLVFTLVRFSLMSYVMFALFAPAHYPADAQLVDKDALGKNFLMLQTLTTINFRTGPIGRLLCGGVEFQIEHHLFPTISPRHYPQMSKHVKAFCDKHGYPYRSEGWGRAIWLSVLTFRRPKPIRSGLPAPAGQSRSAQAAKPEVADAVA